MLHSEGGKCHGESNAEEHRFTWTRKLGETENGGTIKLAYRTLFLIIPDLF